MFLNKIENKFCVSRENNRHSFGICDANLQKSPDCVPAPPVKPLVEPPVKNFYWRRWNRPNVENC